MVTYRLDLEEKERLMYFYFPEGKEDKAPGIIKVDRIKEKVSIIKVAESDFERDIPAEEINELIDSINEMKKERGETKLDEHTDKSEHSAYYGDHAVRNLVERLNNGEVPKEGCAMWY